MHLVFTSGIYVGLRKNEIGNAKWEWFDFENDVIRATDEDGFETKPGRTQTIALNEDLKKVLRRYQESERGRLFYRGRKTWKKLVRTTLGILLRLSVRKRVLSG